VTFSYDRSLEYRFYEAAKQTFGLDIGAAVTLTAKVKILHVYGQLGAFSAVDGPDVRAYRSDPTPGAITIAANGIRVIPEARKDDGAFLEAREWFKWADHIAFLGFGFDSLNIERLDLAPIVTDRKIKADPLSVFATTRDKTETEVKNYGTIVCGDVSHWMPIRIKLPHNVGCHDALREWGWLQ
jgi:hypothetical protein